MDGIIRNIVEIIFISIALFMGITTAFHIINNGGDIIEFVVDNEIYHTGSSMDFSRIVIDDSYIQFNNSGFYIHSLNSIDITLSYVNDDIINAGDGDLLLSFMADTIGGFVWFNISGFNPGTSYLIKMDMVNHATIDANASGFISFSNSVWSLHEFTIYQQGAGNNPPNLPSNPSPIDGMVNVSQSTNLSWSGGDPDSDNVSYDVYFGTNNPPEKVIGNHSQTTYSSVAFSYNTLYYWRIVSWDEHGVKRVGSIWSFRTEEGIDIIPPVIENLIFQTSIPIDLMIGWENISVNVTDNVGVSNVYLRIINPDLSIDNYSMTHGHGSLYFYNNTFISAGNYTYSIWANDGGNNGNTSSEETFVLYPNWDINMDRRCDTLDLVAVSNVYGMTNNPGWIREDVDNNGIIQVLDITITANYYGTSY